MRRWFHRRKSSPGSFHCNLFKLSRIIVHEVGWKSTWISKDQKITRLVYLNKMRIVNNNYRKVLTNFWDSRRNIFYTEIITTGNAYFLRTTFLKSKINLLIKNSTRLKNVKMPINKWTFFLQINFTMQLKSCISSIYRKSSTCINFICTGVYKEEEKNYRCMSRKNCKYALLPSLTARYPIKLISLLRFRTLPPFFPSFCNQ